MIISILGYTERRPVLYTLMKVCQKLGDTAVITDDRHLKRLIADEELSHYQNILIDVTDETADEWMENTSYNTNDFEYIITDGKLAGGADIIIFCKGLIVTEAEQDELEYLDEYIEIGMGKSVKAKIKCDVPAKMYETFERIESMKQLVEVDSKLSAILSKTVGPKLGLNPTQFAKAVTSR